MSHWNFSLSMMGVTTRVRIMGGIFGHSFIYSRFLWRRLFLIW